MYVERCGVKLVGCNDARACVCVYLCVCVFVYGCKCDDAVAKINEKCSISRLCL